MCTEHDESPENPCPVTTLFARRVRRGHEAQYERWLEGVAEAAAAFEGYRGTTTLKPSGQAPAGAHDEYLAMLHFDSAACRDRWLDSAEHRRWLRLLEAIPVEHEEVCTHSGLQRWFTRPSTPAPADYKIAALILLGLYPLVLLLDVALGPLTKQLPPALAALIGLLISVPAMVWIVLPLLSKLFARWLYPRPRPSN